MFSNISRATCANELIFFNFSSSSSRGDKIACTSVKGLTLVSLCSRRLRLDTIRVARSQILYINPTNTIPSALMAFHNQCRDIPFDSEWEESQPLAITSGSSLKNLLSSVGRSSNRALIRINHNVNFLKRGD